MKRKHQKQKNKQKKLKEQKLGEDINNEMNDAINKYNFDGFRTNYLSDENKFQFTSQDQGIFTF